MPTKQDLNDALTSQETAFGEVKTSIDNLSSELQAAIKRLEDKIAAGGTPEDFQAEVDRVNALTTALQAAKAVLDDAIGKAQAAGV